MVDGHRRDDGVETPDRGQRLGEIVLYELDALVAGEALACCFEHELGEIERHATHMRTVDPQHGEQASVAGPEVEDATSVARYVIEQHALALRAAGVLVRELEIARDVLGGHPLLGGHAVIVG
jgi:hypothetical protein